MPDKDGLNLCAECAEAIELDQIAIVKIDGAEAAFATAGDGELAVIACDPHLRRVALALELLAAQEKALAAELPGLVEVAYRDRVIVTPERRAP